MSIYTPAEGIERFHYNLKGMRRYHPSTPFEEMQETQSTYQELLCSIARRNLIIDEHTEENENRATDAIRIKNHQEKIYLIIDPSSCTIKVLLKPSKAPENKKVSDSPSEKNENMRKQTRRLQRLIKVARSKFSGLFQKKADA